MGQDNSCPIIIYSIILEMCRSLAQSRPIFANRMITYYCHSFEEALKRARQAGKRPGCYYGGITLKSGVETGSVGISVTAESLCYRRPMCIGS